jgi:cytidine deaminase
LTGRPRGALVLESSGRSAAGTTVEFEERPDLGICAERAALTAAIVEKVHPDDIVIWTAEGAAPPWPCGACRQVLAELAPRATLWLQIGDRDPRRAKVGELLPLAFGGGDLPHPSPAQQKGSG